ncbi:hypothetical protein K0M31_003014, partial [Melipona bicolor]
RPSLPKREEMTTKKKKKNKKEKKSNSCSDDIRGDISGGNIRKRSLDSDINASPVILHELTTKNLHRNDLDVE